MEDSFSSCDSGILDVWSTVPPLKGSPGPQAKRSLHPTFASAPTLNCWVGASGEKLKSSALLCPGLGGPPISSPVGGTQSWAVQGPLLLGKGSALRSVLPFLSSQPLELQGMGPVQLSVTPDLDLALSNDESRGLQLQMEMVATGPGETRGVLQQPARGGGGEHWPCAQD